MNPAAAIVQCKIPRRRCRGVRHSLQLQIMPSTQSMSWLWQSIEDALHIPMNEFWQRNTAIDQLFYDGSSVPASAAALPRHCKPAEGAAVQAPPTGAGAALLDPTSADFLADHSGAACAPVVAGVGSPALAPVRWRITWPMRLAKRRRAWPFPHICRCRLHSGSSRRGVAEMCIAAPRRGVWVPWRGAACTRFISSRPGRTAPGTRRVVREADA